MNRALSWGTAKPVNTNTQKKRVKQCGKHRSTREDYEMLVTHSRGYDFNLHMTHSPWPLTPVPLIHLFVQRVELWPNSDHRQGPGPGVRSDFLTPDVRARGHRGEGGNGFTEKGWRRMRGCDRYRTRRKRMKIKS